MISVMVPALNEEALLARTVNDIIAAAEKAGGLKLDIIIVNDGSRDRTGEIAEDLKRKHPFVQVVHNEKNIGVGESFKKAVPLAKYPHFIIIAGDNDMPQALMVDIFRNSHKAELVLAYFLNREARGRGRNLVSMFFQAIYMFSFNVFVMYITGPCLYPTERIRTFKILSRRFSIPVELTLKCLLSGCTFYEIGGYKNAIQEDGQALNFRNLWEVVATYFKLLYEIKITGRTVYNRTPIRKT